MYLAGVSVRRVEDITEALWGTRVSSGTVSRLNQKIYRHIEAWRNRAITGGDPVRISGRANPQEKLGGRGEEHLRSDCDRRRDRWFSANPRCRGRPEGGPGGLA